MAETPSELLDAIKGALISDQGAKAILHAARLEKQLQLLLMTLMPKASNALKAKLFKYPGALSTFSSKIDVAFALGLIPADLNADLHAVRGIRNAFAHSVAVLDLHADEVTKELKKLSGWKADANPLKFYEEVAKRSSERLIGAFKNRSARLQSLVQAAEAQTKQLRDQLPDED